MIFRHSLFTVYELMYADVFAEWVTIELQGQMNDASEVLAVIFDCLHRAFTTGLHGSDSESVECSGMESWECTKKNACIVHSLFGMDISEQMNCQSCGVESRHLKYNAFFHNINATALRTMKVIVAGKNILHNHLFLHVQNFFF